MSLLPMGTALPSFSHRRWGVKGGRQEGMKKREPSTSSTSFWSGETHGSNDCTGVIQQPPKGQFMQGNAFIPVNKQP